MTTKKLLLWLSIATAVGTIIGVLGKIAYDRGCEVTEVKQVSAATSELYIDVKEIKKTVGNVETNAAVTANKVSNIEKDVNEMKSMLNRFFVPKQLAEVSNGVQVK